MWDRRQFVFALNSAVLSSALILCGCNSRGEDAVPEKDFATSSTIKTAIGAAGSTFIAPIMNNWITAYQQIHPSIKINYRPIGSGAGLAELKQTLLELAASVLAKDARTPIVDPPATAKDAYPISGLTFLLIPKNGSDAEQRRALRDFIQYTVTTGQDSAESLAYAKLPKSLQQHDLTLLAGLTADGQLLK